MVRRYGKSSVICRNGMPGVKINSESGRGSTSSGKGWEGGKRRYEAGRLLMELGEGSE
jgi:hypothetical protein